MACRLAAAQRRSSAAKARELSHRPCRRPSPSPRDRPAGTFQRASAARTRCASARSGVISAAVRFFSSRACRRCTRFAQRRALASDSSSGLAASISVRPVSAACFYAFRRKRPSIAPAQLSVDFGPGRIASGTDGFAGVGCALGANSITASRVIEPPEGASHNRGGSGLT